MKKNKIYLVEPVKGLDFKTLFRFFWDQGAGNFLTSDDQPTPWNPTALSSRLADFGYEVDVRTIQNWLSGSSMPSATNTHRIARVASNNDKTLEPAWRDAFILSKLSTIKSKAEFSVSYASDQNAEQLNNARPRGKSKVIRMPLFLMISIILGLVFVMQYSRNSASTVTSLKFCDRERFSFVNKTCSTNMTHFPAEIKVIYVSFNLPNAKDGQSFKRKWYRAGQLFLEKEGYLDDAWEDYTWLMNPEGHDDGRYNLRIIVNRRTTTGSFYVGNVDTDHKWP